MDGDAGDADALAEGGGRFAKDGAGAPGAGGEAQDSAEALGNRWSAAGALDAAVGFGVPPAPIAERLARLTAEVSGVPTPVLRSQEQVDAIRAQRAQQEQEAMAIQAAQPIAGAMKDAAQANQLLMGA